MKRHRSKLFQDATLPPRTVVQLVTPASEKQIPSRRKREPNIGSFKKGNKAAEKWTEETVLPILQKMYDTLVHDDITGQSADNPVRANNIKLQKEICLICGITCFIYTDWKNKFAKEELINKTNKIIEPNKDYNAAVSTLKKK